MRYTIHRFEVADTFGPSYISMPMDSKLLCVKVVDRKIYLYALVNADEIVCKDRRFIIFEEGDTIESADALNYIDTFVLNDLLVYHFFEMKRSF